MKQTLKKLMSLNLALLMALSLLSGAALAEGGETAAATEYAAVRREKLPEEPDVPDVGLMEVYTAPPAMAAAALAEGEPYRISVGGTSFLSNETASGTGWEYTDGKLRLNGYNGSGIAASGDLTVYSSGAVTVQGFDTTTYNYGGAALEAAGVVTVYVEGGTFNAYGGDGCMYGGDGISAPMVALLFTAGTANIRGGDGSSRGGDGLFGLYMYVLTHTEGGGSFTCIGGNAPTAQSETFGGCGISTRDLYVTTHGEICGGNGATPAPAVLYEDTCEFGLCNIRMCSGVDNRGYIYYAILAPEDAEPVKLAHHTHAYKSGKYTCIGINNYTLTLRGAGGITYTGATFTDLTGYYPTAHWLGPRVFQREGYTQVNWETTSGELLPLSGYRTPTRKDILDAVWTETGPGDILINGSVGDITENVMWEKTSGVSVTLPESIAAESGALVGWSTEIVATASSLQLLPGVWYAPGSTVAPDEEAAIALYARPAGDSCYVAYHGTEGTFACGGDMRVQYAGYWGWTNTFTALQGEQLPAAPDGFRFGGWATVPGGEAVYAAGAPVTMNSAGVKHLYAVWEPLEYSYESGEEGCGIWVEPTAKTISVEVTAAWCQQREQPKTLIAALYSGGKMSLCEYEPMPGSGGHSVELSYTGSVLPEVRLFALNSDGAPLGSAVRVDLSKETPAGSR